MGSEWVTWNPFFHAFFLPTLSLFPQLLCKAENIQPCHGACLWNNTGAAKFPTLHSPLLIPSDGGHDSQAEMCIFIPFFWHQELFGMDELIFLPQAEMHSQHFTGFVGIQRFPTQKIPGWASLIQQRRNTWIYSNPRKHFCS